MDNILSVKNLTMRFGGILALNDISFDVRKGSITALIGPNGAGKTTVFNCVTGFYKATEGELLFRKDGKEIHLSELLGKGTKISELISPRFFERLYYMMFGGTHLVVRKGLARTFQNIRLFKEMTVIENLLVAQHNQMNRNLIHGIINTETFRKSEQIAIEKALFWLKELNLENESNILAGNLPYGKAKKLEIARSMCTDPKLICLDEPAAGLNPKETSELTEIIFKLKRNHNVTVLLIEHDMSLVMKISEHVVVLDHGEVIAQGNPDEIKNNPAVIEAYLGSDAV